MTVVAENLSKRFNREWIFRNINQSFQHGSYSIVGPNGSGKSTLLQVLWGQLPATTGVMRYSQGNSIIPPENIYQHISIAAPYIDLIEELTLREILSFHYTFKSVRNGKSLAELTDLFELSHAHNKQVGHFSSGMKQRLKLGLALHSDVPLIFLDEPTTNLDKPSIDWYWKNFRQIPPETTVFLASNHEAEYPADAVKINLTDYKRGYN